MFSITSTEHALATVAHDVVKGAHAVNTFLAKVSVQAEVAEPEIEKLTAMIDPAAVPIERAAFAALGYLLKAAKSVDAAAAAKGLNVPLDQQAWADFNAIYDQLSTKAKFLAAGQ